MNLLHHVLDLRGVVLDLLGVSLDVPDRIHSCVVLHIGSNKSQHLCVNLFEL